MPSAEQDLMNRAVKIASRWNVRLESPLKHTPARLVYKVATPDGNGVLKLKKKFGSEGGGVPFLRSMPDGLGVKLLRVSPLRRAVLLDWLDGPTLLELLNSGKEAEAEAHLAQVAASLTTATFKNALAIPRLEPWLRRRFLRCHKNLQDTPRRQDLKRTTQLFEELTNTTSRETVIHGDLDFNNALLTPDGPRLIDPKGFRADPASEFHRALMRQQEGPAIDSFADCVRRRAEVLAPAINESPKRLIQWGAVMLANRKLYSMAKNGGSDQPDLFLSAFLDLADS